MCCLLETWVREVPSPVLLETTALTSPTKLTPLPAVRMRFWTILFTFTALFLFSKNLQILDTSPTLGHGA
jgi:hypothetical protein